MQEENINKENTTFKKRLNPTFEALIRLKGAMHTNDPKYDWVR